MCVATAGAFPPIPVASDALGAYDPTFAQDPATARTWMSYSSVGPGPGDLRLVSTRLAYSDDAGTTFCAAGTINDSAPIATAPGELAGVETFWNHEVSKLLYDPFAPAAERWRLSWQRYLIANTGTADEREFQYSWISEKLAATPTELASAPEHKLLAAAGYASSASVQAYNDGVIGPPETRVNLALPALADCVALTEPGELATATARWLAISCATGATASSRIVLLADDRAGDWSYVSRLLGQAEAQAVNAALDGFSGAELAPAPAGASLIAAPTVGGVYKGCIEYAVALPSGTVNPTPVRALQGTTAFSGPCGYDPGLRVAGIVLGQADVTAMPPTFAVFATGMAP